MISNSIKLNNIENISHQWPKNVIFIIKQTYYNKKKTDKEFFWGLGDILRGIADIHDLCLSNGLNFYVDITQHPISNYLDPDFSTQPPDFLKKNLDYDLVPFVLNVEDFFNENSQSETLIFFSNQILNLPFFRYKKETQEFLKKIFRPSTILQEEINKHIQNLPSPFSVIHFRTGDDEIVRNDKEFCENNYSIVSSLYEKYNSTLKNPVVFTDSQIIRRKLIEEFYVKTIDHDIAHLGYHTNLESIKNSLIDFFIISHAKKILGYTTYRGLYAISGFVRMVGQIYDISVKPIP